MPLTHLISVDGVHLASETGSGKLLAVDSADAASDDCCCGTFYEAEICSCCNPASNECDSVYVSSAYVAGLGGATAYFEYNGLCYSVSSASPTTDNPDVNCINLTPQIDDYADCDECCDDIIDCDITGCGELWERGKVIVTGQIWHSDRIIEKWEDPGDPSCPSEDAGEIPAIAEACQLPPIGLAGLPTRRLNRNVDFRYWLDAPDPIECLYDSCQSGIGVAVYEGVGEFLYSEEADVVESDTCRGDCNNLPILSTFTRCPQVYRTGTRVRATMDVDSGTGATEWTIDWFKSDGVTIAQSYTFSTSSCEDSASDANHIWQTRADPVDSQGHRDCQNNQCPGIFGCHYYYRRHSAPTSNGPLTAYFEGSLETENLLCPP